MISSAPVRELVEKVTPTPISLFHARALRYRDFLAVALMVRKGDLFPDNWIYIRDPSVKVGRIQNFGSWSPEMVPAGMSCLGLEHLIGRNGMHKYNNQNHAMMTAMLTAQNIVLGGRRYVGRSTRTPITRPAPRAHRPPFRAKAWADAGGAGGVTVQ